jgi:hypothetical protein
MWRRFLGPSAAWFYKVEWATHKAASCAHYLFNYLARRGNRSVGDLSQLPKDKRQAPMPRASRE